MLSANCIEFMDNLRLYLGDGYITSGKSSTRETVPIQVLQYHALTCGRCCEYFDMTKARILQRGPHAV